MLRSKSGKVTITPSGRARVFETNAAEGDPTTAVELTFDNLEDLIDSNGAAVSNGKITKTCFAYVYGGDHTENTVVATSYRDATSVAAQTITVSVTDTGA